MDFHSVEFIEITAKEQGQRIDNFLFNKFSNLPKSKIYKIIRKGEVRVNKKRIKAEYKLQNGDLIRIPPLFLENPEHKKIIIPEFWLKEIKNSVLYEDEDFLILNKPNGIAVHSGSGQDYGVFDCVAELWGENYAKLCHRLDRDTSGVLVLGKNNAALRAFQNAEIEKIYLCLTNGWKDNCKEVKIYLKKIEDKVIISKEGGVLAKTIFKIEEKFNYKNLVLLSAKLQTGRTHQIRVSVQSQGFSIIGDNRYGDFDLNREFKKLNYNSMFLHSKQISFLFNDKLIKVFAPLPNEAKNLLTFLREQ